MKRAVLAFLLLAVAGGGVFAFWHLSRLEAPLTAYQGYVEGNLVQAGPEESGRIERLFVQSGDEVNEGQLLFSLEASVQSAQVDEARARLKQASAQLENLRAAGQRPEQIAVLQAARERAQSALEFSSAELQRQKVLFERGYTAKAKLDQAEATFEHDKAMLQEAQHQISAAQLAGRTGEIEAGEAAVRAAEAALQQAETRLAKRQIFSPVKARVQDVFYRAGEVVNVSQPVLSLLPPGNLKIRFYVPEPSLATLPLGSVVTIRCDSCPGDMRARINFVSSEVEFTPPVIFSEQERSKLVFRAEALPIERTPLPIGLPVTVIPAGSSSL